MEALVQQVLAHELVKNFIALGVDNTERLVFPSLESTPEKLSKVEAALTWWTVQVAETVMKKEPPMPDQSAPGWKEQVSNWTFEALDYYAFEKACTPTLAEKFAEIGGGKPEDYVSKEKPGKMLGMVPYSLTRIAMNAGPIAYMVKLGLDPDLLRPKAS